MTWVTFTSRAAFDAYNQQACADRAIPRPGYRQSDHAPQIGNQWTLAWCQPFGVFNSTSGAKVLANVPDADVKTYNLTLAPAAPVIAANGQRTIVFEGATRTIFTTAAATLQPKPASWTDPNTGTIYKVT